MFNKLKKKLNFLRCDLLINEGLRNGTIVPFEDDLYERLSKIYFNGYPLSIQIKYLKPMVGPGQCEDRSWFITMAFDDALWVSGDNKDLELKFGKQGAWHFWVEHDDWVYDPTLLYKFKKEVYYNIYLPTNIVYRKAEEYKKHEWYQDVVKTTVEDLKPGGKKRVNLCMSIPLVQGISQMSDNKDFINELDQHLKMIEYDYKQVVGELDSSIASFTRKRT